MLKFFLHCAIIFSGNKTNIKKQSFCNDISQQKELAFFNCEKLTDRNYISIFDSPFLYLFVDKKHLTDTYDTPEIQNHNNKKINEGLSKEEMEILKKQFRLLYQLEEHCIPFLHNVLDKNFIILYFMPLDLKQEKVFYIKKGIFNNYISINCNLDYEKNQDIFFNQDTELKEKYLYVVAKQNITYKTNVYYITIDLPLQKFPNHYYKYYFSNSSDHLFIKHVEIERFASMKEISKDLFSKIETLNTEMIDIQKKILIEKIDNDNKIIFDFSKDHSFMQIELIRNNVLSLIRLKKSYHLKFSNLCNISTNLLIQRIIYQSFNLITTKIWNEIHHHVITLNQWITSNDSYYYNHKFYNENNEIKCFKWYIFSEYNIYNDNSKLCIIGKNCKINTNFKWGNYVFIENDVIIGEDVYCGYNNVILKNCLIGNVVKISGSNFLSDGITLSNKTRIGKNNLFGSNFVYGKHNFEDSELFKKHKKTSTDITLNKLSKNCIGEDNVFGKNVKIGKFSCICNSNLIGSNVTIPFHSKIGSNNIIGNFCEFQERIDIHDFIWIDLKESFENSDNSIEYYKYSNIPLNLYRIKEYFFRCNQ